MFLMYVIRIRQGIAEVGLWDYLDLSNKYLCHHKNNLCVNM